MAYSYTFHRVSSISDIANYIFVHDTTRGHCIKSQYLFPDSAKPFPSNQNGKYQCFNCAFQSVMYRGVFISRPFRGSCIRTYESKIGLCNKLLISSNDGQINSNMVYILLECIFITMNSASSYIYSKLTRLYDELDRLLDLQCTKPFN